MASPYDLMNSQALRNYRPNLMTNAPMAQAQSEAPDLTNRMLEILGGNFGGTLSSGERLSALGALLKSVSRGSQTSPQQVMQAIQQQKLGQVQGALQVQELRKQAAEKANAAQIRERLLANAKTEEERDQIRLLDEAGLQQFALKRLDRPADDVETKQRQLNTYFKIYNEEGPEKASAYWRLVAPGQVVGSIESGLSVYNPPEPTMARGSAVGGVSEITAPRPKPVEPTESERTAGFLTKRLNDALQTIDRIGQTDPEALSPSFGTEAVRGILGETAANVISSPARQQVEAAQLDALDAALTLGTGAAYTREQLEGYRKSYFPQVGDDPATIADKARRRQVLFESAKIKAGRSAPKPSAPKKPSGPRTFTIDGKKITVTKG